jgi:hypothetical protein
MGSQNDVAGGEHDMALLHHKQMCQRACRRQTWHRTQGTPQEGIVITSDCAWPMQRNLTEHCPNWAARDDATEGKYRPEVLLQVDPIECAHESILLPQETLLGGLPVVLEWGLDFQGQGSIIGIKAIYA